MGVEIKIEGYKRLWVRDFEMEIVFQVQSLSELKIFALQSVAIQAADW